MSVREMPSSAATAVRCAGVRAESLRCRPVRIGSMTPNLTEYGKNNQPHSENASGYLPSVETRPDPKLVLAQNVEALMRHHYGERNINRLRLAVRTSPANIQRILDGRTSVGLDLIEKIAAKFDVLPWQLLVPGFDPAHKPVLARAGLSEEQWYQMLKAAETVMAYNLQLHPPRSS